MALNGRNGSNGWKWLDIIGTGRIGWKWLDIAGNSWKWLVTAEMA